MYIQPNSTVQLLRGIPLTERQTDTLWFPAAADQDSYFSQAGRVAKTFTAQSYTRKDRGVIRLDAQIADVYDCNYMRYKNTSHENKWFYAFIRQINYVNENTCEVVFIIDPVQTWFFETTLKRCFVERQHAVSDVIGENLAPEPVELGEYIFNDYNALLDTSNVGFIVAVCVVGESAQASVHVYDGILSGATLFYFYAEDQAGNPDIATTAAEVTAFIQDSGYASSFDSILSIYAIPAEIAPVIQTGRRVPDAATGISVRKNYLKPDADTEIDGYLPKNKKLLTYPYNFLFVNNGAGGSLNLRYEFFESTPVPGSDEEYITLVAQSCITQPVQLTVKPEDYKGVSGVNDTECLTMANFPSCSWNVDYYKAWLAQNTVPLEQRLLGQAVNIGISAAAAYASGGLTAGAAVNQGLNMLSSVSDVLMANYSASNHADICRGSLQSGNVNVANGRQNFYVGRVSVNEDYARRIDDFFTMYGYAINRITIPNRHARSAFTYLKTKGCVVDGSIPADDAAELERIHDAGIRYWVYTSDMYNYNVANSVL